jgi:hypothetical protein
MKPTPKEFMSRLTPLRCKLAHSLQLIWPSACLSMSHRFPRAPFSVFAVMSQAWLVSFPFGDVESVGRP